MPRVLFYDDMPAYGGHQVMTAHGIEAVLAADDCEVLAAISPTNRKNHERLGTLEKLQLIKAPHTSRRLEGLRLRLEPQRVRQFQQWLRPHNPDLVVAVQGDIEGSALALVACAAMDVPCVSYIPVPHTLAEMGARLGSLRDPFNTWLFRQPDAWITISQAMADILRLRGATQPITLVPNGIETDALASLPPITDARKQLGLPAEVPLLGIVGRIEFKQKGQDFAVRALAEQPQLQHHHLAIVGSGPDETELRKRVREYHLENRVHLVPWQRDPKVCYAAIDTLLVPSRYEGVPLVMLEMLAAGKPVIATDRDGMRDHLPAAWRFPAGDAVALATAIQELPKTAPRLLPDLTQRTRASNNLRQFGQAFVTAITDCLARPRAL